MNEMDAVSNHSDLVDAIREILTTSKEPLTLAKIRAHLSAPFDRLQRRELADVLDRQVAANVIVVCPKYRGSRDRYWDRPLREHAVVVLRGALADGPIPWSDLRKRVPKYMRHLAESVLNEELAKGAIHRHPPTSARAGFRYALAAADIRAFAMTELEAALARLVERGFSLSDAREAFMHLLQEAEWSEDAPLDAVPHGVATETWYTTNYQHELTGG